MSNARSSDETTVLATYTSRRDAEVAREYLADADIRTFVRADDAGGMHPQLQRPHGVKLVGMHSTAQKARAVLEDADLLPEEGTEAASVRKEGEEGNDLTFSSDGWSFTGASIAILVAVVLGLLLLGSL